MREVEAFGGLELCEGSRRAVIVAPLDVETREACFDLRRTYRRRAGWSIVSEVPDGYDSASAQLAVIRDARVVATLRSTAYHPDPGFMLEREFIRLVDRPGEVVFTASSLEVSGLATGLGDSSERLMDVMVLFRLWFRLASATWTTRAYFVTDDNFLGHLTSLEEPIQRYVHPLGPWRSLGADRLSRAMWVDIVGFIEEAGQVAPDVAKLLFP
jgi:hypothetical protein